MSQTIHISQKLTDALNEDLAKLNHFRCRYCSEVCINHETHLCHEARHIPNTIYYPCVMCYKKFSNAYSLRLHIQVKHLGISKYKCSFCHKTFRQKSHLIEHERIHTGERPFKCHLCFKGFATHSHLKVHTRSKHRSPLISNYSNGLDSAGESNESASIVPLPMPVTMEIPSNFPEGIHDNTQA